MNLDLDGGGSTAWAKWPRQQVIAFVADDAGVTAIEYALLAALIAVTIAGAVGALGLQLLAMWTVVSDAVTAAV